MSMHGPLALSIISSPHQRRVPRPLHHFDTNGGTIGRGDRDSLILPDHYVSRRHAEISVEGGRYLLHVMGTNGATLNTQAFDPGATVKLSHGDLLSVAGFDIAVGIGLVLDRRRWWAVKRVGQAHLTEWAVASARPDTLRLLLDLGVPITAPAGRGSSLLAAAAGAPGAHDELLRLVGLLIKTGADVDATDASGATALHAAVRSNRGPVAYLLLERGASVNLCSGEGHTPLDEALAARDIDMAALLSEYGGRTNADHDAVGQLRARLAKSHTELDALKWSLSAGLEGESCQRLERLDSLLELETIRPAPCSQAASTVEQRALFFDSTATHSVAVLIEVQTQHFVHEPPTCRRNVRHVEVTGIGKLCAELVATGAESPTEEAPRPRGDYDRLRLMIADRPEHTVTRSVTASCELLAKAKALLAAVAARAA